MGIRQDFFYLKYMLLAFNEIVYNLGVSSNGGQDQRCVTVVGLQVWIGSVVQQVDHQLHGVAVQCCKCQGCVSIVALDVEVHPSLDQVGHNVNLTL